MIKLSIKSLLIADDDMDDLTLLLSALDVWSSDLNISHVGDGAELLTFLCQDRLPDLILLDINIPKINGIDCLQRIKAAARFDGIPIIMYSTSSNDEVIEKCYQLGASRYIVKPYKYDEIVDFMKMILSIDWKKSKMISKNEFLLSSNNH